MKPLLAAFVTVVKTSEIAAVALKTSMAINPFETGFRGRLYSVNCTLIIRAAKTVHKKY